MNRKFLAGALGLVALVTMGSKCDTTTGGAPANSHKGPVNISVTGVGSANDITVLDGSQETQHNSASLPWSTTLTDNPADVGVTAQSGDGSSAATISCEIDMPGLAPVKNTSTGAYAVVDCNANNF